MKQHYKSLLLSLLIHSLFVAILFYLYLDIKDVKIPSTHIKKNQLCVHLQSIKTDSTNKIHKKVSHFVKKKKKRIYKKKIHKKVHKIIVKKVVKKRQVIEKKKIVHLVKVKKSPSVKSVMKKVEKEQNRLSKTVTKKKSVVVEKSKSKNDEEVYIQNNLSKIILLIKENLYYPRRARKRGVQGLVLVKFFLDKNGNVSHIQVVSSKSAILSRAAMKTINNLSGEFPKPTKELKISLPINYRLR